MKARLLFLAAALAAPAAWPCGVCVEDKMAATYDHEVALRAKEKGQVIVFCEISGADVKRIAETAARTRGVDRASVRVSREPAALSFALDGRKQSPQTAIEAIRKAAPPGTKVSLLRVVTH